MTCIEGNVVFFTGNMYGISSIYNGCCVHSAYLNNLNGRFLYILCTSFYVYTHTVNKMVNYVLVTKYEVRGSILNNRGHIYTTITTEGPYSK